MGANYFSAPTPVLTRAVCRPCVVQPRLLLRLSWHGLVVLVRVLVLSDTGVGAGVGGVCTDDICLGVRVWVMLVVVLGGGVGAGAWCKSWCWCWC